MKIAFKGIFEEKIVFLKKIIDEITENINSYRS